MTARLYIVHEATKFRHDIGTFDDHNDAADAGECWFETADYEIEEDGSTIARESPPAEGEDRTIVPD